MALWGGRQNGPGLGGSGSISLCSLCTFAPVGCLLLARWTARLPRLTRPPPAGMGKKDDPKLMQEWFRLVQEKNAMVRYESELMIL